MTTQTGVVAVIQGWQTWDLLPLLQLPEYSCWEEMMKYKIGVFSGHAFGQKIPKLLVPGKDQLLHGL